MKRHLTETRSSETKQWIIGILLDDGFGSFAKAFNCYKFVIADFYHGKYIPVAAMFPDYKEVVLNPSMLDLKSIHVNNDTRDDLTKLKKQVSVLMRHELLHFLLHHQMRFMEHLKNKYPDMINAYKRASIQDIANRAMDYDISNWGYDDDDEETVRLMTKNGAIVGGLIAKDDHPEWGEKTMEEMYDILYKEHKENLEKNPEQFAKTIVTIKKSKNTPEYKSGYNKLLAAVKGKKFTDDELNKMLAALQQDDDVITPDGVTLLRKGE